MRVHELAKAVQMESKDILAIAKKHRIPIKASPSANVEDKDIRRMMPLIDKYKGELKAKEEEDRRRKDEERKAREEERRRKEEERRRELEAKRKSEEDERRQAEERARTEGLKKQEEERKAREAAARQQKEEEARRRQEDERLRSLGFRVPVRSPEFRPKAPEPAAPPQPRPAQQQPGAAPSARPASSPAQAGGIRPGGGTGIRPGAGTGFSQGAPRPGGGQQRPGGGAGGDRPGYQGQGGPRPDRPGYQGQGGPRPDRPGYQGQGGPRPDRSGYQGQGGPRPDRPGYQGQGGPRPDRPGYQGQGGPRPDRPGYQGQGGQRPDRPGYQGQGGARPDRPGYQGQGGPRPDRPGYQGQRPSGYQGQGGPGGPRGDRPFQQRPPREGGGGPGQRSFGDRPTGPAQLTEANLPQIGVMRLDKPAGRKTDRDKKPPAKGADKKRGKVAPRKIFELDEDMTVTARPRPAGAGPGRTDSGPRPMFGTRHRGGRKPGRGARVHRQESDSQRPKQVTIESPVTVAQFAEKMNVPPAEIIKKVLLDMGEALTMNATLSDEYIELLAPEFGVDVELIRSTDEGDVEPLLETEDESRMQRRPPVVTIMGHVDHGKTSLLDFIRNSKVMEGEFGGITQHIGAYQVNTAKGPITFLDTPGHEAFTSMRARGAGVTDLVILVVAANDGFKPQTIEAVHHAQAAEVPIVVAVNKIDLPGADPARVRQEALQHNLVSEELGGEVIFVDISAKQGTNIDQLLEMVALQSEILDLKADAGIRAQGTIVESHVDPTRGAVATVLVQRGTLRVGDAFVAGAMSGRVRAMVNDRGKAIKEAGPAFPAEIIGLTGSPSAGETFLVMPDEQVARDVAEKREFRRRMSTLNPTQSKHITLESLHEHLQEGKTQDLNMIVKADVQGSIEAIRQSLDKLSNDQVRIRILHAAVGGINESDVNLAAASDAIIIGFNVRPEVGGQELATQEGVEIKLYRIIYDLIEEVRQAMQGLLAPTFREKVLGHAEVRQIFKASRLGTIAGCYVRDGEIVRDSKARVVRDSVVVYEGSLGSVRRVKEDVKRVAAGLECGLTLENFQDVKEGDIIEVYEMEQIATTLEPAKSS